MKGFDRAVLVMRPFSSVWSPRGQRFISACFERLFTEMRTFRAVFLCRYILPRGIFPAKTCRSVITGIHNVTYSLNMESKGVIKRVRQCESSTNASRSSLGLHSEHSIVSTPSSFTIPRLVAGKSSAPKPSQSAGRQRRRANQGDKTTM